jgi:hypothetical protein
MYYPGISLSYNRNIIIIQHNYHNYGKSPLIGKSTVNGHFQWQTVCLPEGIVSSMDPSGDAAAVPELQYRRSRKLSDVDINGDCKLWMPKLAGWFIS